ncbi:hypothetical protein KOW79_006478 [Hemibagrus wyckioides]|uniref:USP domain-containing protein n=1 Tax=Hemibagrus wyckioides TaxID=337641 RepID=A0A9D3NXB0_9TELE|nr:uncharacterized protein si:ch211-212k18.13 [Hemibagrus wyckioides]KAG7330256.1 hypothetical protein KOW79_006478 [Hemibagrus wyckioides]
MESYRRPYRYQEARSNVQEGAAGKRYNGLRNQGATCYLNSVLQCLYMTEDFRKEVEKFVPNQINSDEERLVQELQKLFEGMKERDCTTEGITRCLGITKVYVQEDVVEYYQKTLKAIGPQLSKVFEGKMSNKTKCLNDHICEEECRFFTIPLAIEAGNSEVFDVVKGLNTFFEPVMLDEDNWLYCKDCGQKNETWTWNEIEEFPTILTLYPKRFYFDYYTMRHVKNHCPMDIPLHLLIRNNEYELYAVINHTESEYGGHYNAVIKSFEDDKWYCFDDSSVSLVLRDPPNDSINLQKAYLLMYRMKYSQKEKRRLQQRKELLKTTFYDRHCSDDPKDAKDSFQNSQKWHDNVTSSSERGHRETSSSKRGHRATSSGEQEHKATSLGDGGCSEREHRASHSDEHHCTSSDEHGCGAASSAECLQTRLDSVTSSIDPWRKASEGLCCGAESSAEQGEMDGQHPSVKSTYSKEHNKTLENLKQDSHTFKSRSQGSGIFSADEHKQSASTYNNGTQYYNNLHMTTEQGEQNNSVCNNYVAQNMSRSLERYESNISCCGQPVDTEPLKDFAQETTDQLVCCEAEPDKPVNAELCNPVVVYECGIEYVNFEESLKEAWQAVFDKVKWNLQKVNELLQAHRQRYDCLIQWLADARQRQKMIQAKPIIDNKVPNEQLAQGKELLEEIKNKEDNVNKCVNYAIDCIDTIKGHECQLEICKASLKPFRSIKVESVSDIIMQEIDNLKTCYNEVLMLTIRQLYNKTESRQKD